MGRVYIDIESFSKTDIRTHGAYRYAECPSTMVLCYAVAYEDEETILWVEDDPVPSELSKWAADPDCLFVAHNAPFEMIMLNGDPGKKIGFPEIPTNRWRCTMAKSRVRAIPGGLDKASRALRLITKKDMDGHSVMLKLCRPRKPTKKNPDIRWTPETKTEDFEKLYDYCINDIITTRELDRVLKDLTENEQRLWELDHVINGRGIRIDVSAVDQIVKVRDAFVDTLEEQCVELCGSRSSLREQIMGWSAQQGWELENYTKDYIADQLENESPPGPVREVLEIRQQTGKISTKKYAALVEATSGDGRLRGTLLFHGAQTGRWSGVKFQPHNLARGSLSDPDQAIEDIMQLSFEGLRIMYGNLMEVFSSCIRGMVIAGEGKELAVTDYASIEARVVQWLAGDMEACHIFASGLDMYKVMASEIFQVPYEEITKEQRFVGKTAILGLGYQMGWKRFLEQCHQYGATYVTEELARLAVDTFRNKFWKLKRFWKTIQNKAMEAIRDKGNWIAAGPRISFGFDGTWLIMKLPSGRYIYYFEPEIVDKTFEHEGRQYTSEAIQYQGVDTKTRRFGTTLTFGGRLVENATQAIARDIMVDGIWNLEKEGHQVILHVHDEIVCEVEKGALPIERMEEIMCTPPPWGPSIPIAAEGFLAQRYRK